MKWTILLILVPLVTSNLLSPTKYEITLTPDFPNGEYSSKVRIHVKVNGIVGNFNLQLSKSLRVKTVEFFQAAVLDQGKPLGFFDTGKLTVHNDSIHVDLAKNVTQESSKEAAFIDIHYKGSIGKKGTNKGIYYINPSTFETNLKNGNVIQLFPILEDVPVHVNLSVITPYRAEVQTNLKTGKHSDVPGGKLISNNFNNGEKTVKISEIYFKIDPPFVQDFILE